MRNKNSGQKENVEKSYKVISIKFWTIMQTGQRENL